MWERAIGAWLLLRDCWADLTCRHHWHPASPMDGWQCCHCYRNALRAGRDRAAGCARPDWRRARTVPAQRAHVGAGRR